MTIHTVVKGECLSKIAAASGLTWQQLWNDDRNKELRKKRKNPNILCPGDKVFVPDKSRPSVPVQLGGTTTVVRRRKGYRTLELRVLDDQGAPVANADYTLTPDGADALTGRTDGDGVLRQDLPVAVESASLEVGDLHFGLEIGHLSPLDGTDDGGVAGAQARLSNLGYRPGPIDGILGPLTAAALRVFQSDEGLAVTGKLDDPTRTRLQARYGC
jgi:hypothetical protein